MDQTIEITLEDLRIGIVGLTRAMGSFYAEAAAVCLDNQGHSDPTPMDVIMHGEQAKMTTTINWEPPDDLAKRNSDLREATEYGAYGIAALIVCKPRALRMERAKTGTGIDYWLTDGPLMQRSARLEVSGILSGSRGAIRARVKKKLTQTEKSAGALPVVVVVVEFSRPESCIAES